MAKKVTKGTFLGKKIAQSEFAIWLWEKFLISVDFERIIDIGTYNGNFSFYLYLQCLQRKKEFVTFDIVNWQIHDHRAHLKNKLDFDKHFIQKDIFNNTHELYLMITKPGVTILFCDGGNKQKELDIFSEYLKKGDYIVVHDWGTESHTKPSKLTEVFSKECDFEGMTRIFKYA